MMWEFLSASYLLNHYYLPIAIGQISHIDSTLLQLFLLRVTICDLEEPQWTRPRLKMSKIFEDPVRLNQSPPSPLSLQLSFFLSFGILGHRNC